MFNIVRWLDSQTHMSDDATVREVWKVSDHKKQRYPGRIRALFALVDEFATDLWHLLLQFAGQPIPDAPALPRIKRPTRVRALHRTVRVLVPAYLLTTVHATAPPAGSTNRRGQAVFST